jgi:serine/threonine protein kinase
VVMRMRWTGGACDVAVKTLHARARDAGGERAVCAFVSEVQLQMALQHDNIVIPVGVVFDDDKLSLVLPLMTMTLHDTLFDARHATSAVRREWSERVRVCGDVAKGLNYLHTRNPLIVHADLKSKNVLLDRHGDAKLADFGLSNAKSELDNVSAANVRRTLTLKDGAAMSAALAATTMPTMIGIGTPAFMAPELTRSASGTGGGGGKKVLRTAASDVYALGVMMWELATLRAASSVCASVDDVSALLAALPSETPAVFAAEVKRCCAFDASKRPRAAEMVQVFAGMHIAETLTVSSSSRDSSATSTAMSSAASASAGSASPSETLVARMAAMTPEQSSLFDF